MTSHYNIFEHYFLLKSPLYPSSSFCCAFRGWMVGHTGFPQFSHRTTLPKTFPIDHVLYSALKLRAVQGGFRTTLEYTVPQCTLWWFDAVRYNNHADNAVRLMLESGLELGIFLICCKNIKSFFFKYRNNTIYFFLHFF